eukprot:378822-Prorocentrum_minimum.AAC.1
MYGSLRPHPIWILILSPWGRRGSLPSPSNRISNPGTRVPNPGKNGLFRRPGYTKTPGILQDWRLSWRPTKACKAGVLYT